MTGGGTATAHWAPWVGKVVLVTSPGPGDGKTTCALSLAAMLAADNRRVLVIDTHDLPPMRRPAQPIGST